MRNDALTVAARARLRSITLDVSLRFDAGVTLVVGPSGAGKTTLLRMLAGLHLPDSGTIRLQGRVLNDGSTLAVPARERDIGFVFQDYALFPHLDVTANVGYGLAARRIPRDACRARVREMLERLHIADLASVKPATLSGGQRQRVALARALVIEPKALLLDEPLAALDLMTRASVRTELADVLRTLAIPTVFVTHDPADARAFPDRVVVLEAGAVTADAPYVALQARAHTPFLAAFAAHEVLS